jgi:hypothetical protein
VAQSRGPNVWRKKPANREIWPRGGRIVEIDILADADRLRELDLSILDD